VVLRVEDALKIEWRKSGRTRQRFYCFSCSGCGCEIWHPRYYLKRASGRCRKCSDKNNGTASSTRNRIRPYEALFNKFTYDRLRAGQECYLTFEDFLVFTEQVRCHYCGGSVSWAAYGLQKNGYRYNLDRKDNTKGYIKGNLTVCCWPCNEMKGDRLSYEEMKAAMKVVLAMRKAPSR
jgi:hypothetical protein